MGKKKKEQAFAGTTALAAILDRSGSMARLIDDMLGGYNAWLAAQQALPGKATLTTTLFDHEIDLVGAANAPVAEATPLTKADYFARGSTALNDAVGRTIAALRATVGPQDRALVLIATDGFENASREWTSAQVKALITELEDAGNWTFVYLSSAPTAWADAERIGTRAGVTVRYEASAHGTHGVWTQAMASTASYRQSGATQIETLTPQDAPK